MSPKRSLEWVLGGAIILVAAVLLFARLGHYALWDDEAYTGLGALGILETGDTSAVIDHNVVGFRGGVMLRNLRDRFQPPLPMYVDAPFVAVLGRSSLAVRLPFALAGFALCCMVALMLSKRNVPWHVYVIILLTLLSAVSMFLYFRQGRYYGLTMLSLAMLVWLYLRPASRGRAIGIATWAFILLGSNYISFIGAAALFGFDYLIWGRRQNPIPLKHLAIMILPVALLGAIVVWIWDPLGMDPLLNYHSAQPVRDRLELAWWYLRDFSRCEFAASALLLAAPALYIWRRDDRLIRGPIAVVIFVAVCAFLSPQVIERSGAPSFADIRYAAAIIPVALAVQVMALLAVAEMNRPAAIALAALAVASNVLTLAPFFGQPYRCTAWQFAHELINPPPEPYSPVIAWMRENVPKGQSVWVAPGWMTYPLMFHDPEPVYAWQFKPPPAGQFQSLPPIQFKGMTPPDYMVLFGQPGIGEFKQAKLLDPNASVVYSIVAQLHYYWQDRFRPELFWRLFTPKQGYNPQTDEIYILHRTSG